MCSVSLPTSDGHHARNCHLLRHKTITRPYRDRTNTAQLTASGHRKARHYVTIVSCALCQHDRPGIMSPLSVMHSANTTDQASCHHCQLCTLSTRQTRHHVNIVSCALCQHDRPGIMSPLSVMHSANTTDEASCHHCLVSYALCQHDRPGIMSTLSVMHSANTNHATHLATHHRILNWANCSVQITTNSWKKEHFS